VAGPAKFKTPVVSLPGKYQVQLEVFDGCSSSFIRACFEVQCNCGPTANARLTSTIWSNANQAGLGDNAAGPTNSFALDGSASYDFDSGPSNQMERLSYDFDLVSWEPAGDQEYGTLRDGASPWEPLPFFGIGGGSQPPPLAKPNAELKIWYKDNARNQNATVDAFGYNVVDRRDSPSKKDLRLRSQTQAHRFCLDQHDHPEPTSRNECVPWDEARKRDV